MNTTRCVVHAGWCLCAPSRSPRCEFAQDGNGTIDVGELQECMRKLGAHMTQEEVGHLFEVLVRWVVQGATVQRLMRLPASS